MRRSLLGVLVVLLVLRSIPVTAASVDFGVTVEVDPLLTSIDPVVPRTATRDAMVQRCPSIILGAPDDDRGIFFSERPMLVVRIRPAPVSRAQPEQRGVLVQVGFTRGSGAEPTWVTAISPGTPEVLASHVRSAVTQVTAAYVCPERAASPDAPRLPPSMAHGDTATTARAQGPMLLPPVIPTSTTTEGRDAWRTAARVLGYSLLTASAVSLGVGVWQGTEVNAAGSAFTRATTQPDILDAQSRGLAASDRANALFLTSAIVAAVGGLAVLLEVIGAFDTEDHEVAETSVLVPQGTRATTLRVPAYRGGDPWNAR
ncbi:hypothetical protein HYV74_03595 [Candidatus Uhrbacteria bacterium]|nr:hypothetical protein [Candidatus Uhrbacteria bacterium]